MSGDQGGPDSTMVANDDVKRPSAKPRKPYTMTKQRERWSEEEHNHFVEALKIHGRQWRKIEEAVKTKTAVQIRSHAQKFFSKLEKQKKQVEAGEVPIASVDVPLDITIPPPRPKRKSTIPYPRKNGSSDELEGTNMAFPDYAAAVRSQGNFTDVTVAAVTAAASAAAAAAAAAVVGAAGKEIEAKLHAAPPNVFPFYGMTPTMLRAMSNPATLQANIQATVNNAERRINGQGAGVERTGTSQPGHQAHPALVHGEDGEDSACSREDADATMGDDDAQDNAANKDMGNFSSLTGLTGHLGELNGGVRGPYQQQQGWPSAPISSLFQPTSAWGAQFSDPVSMAALAQQWNPSDSFKTGPLNGLGTTNGDGLIGAGGSFQPSSGNGNDGSGGQAAQQKTPPELGTEQPDPNQEEGGSEEQPAKGSQEGSGSNPSGNGNGNASINGSIYPANGNKPIAATDAAGNKQQQPGVTNGVTATGNGSSGRGSNEQDQNGSGQNGSGPTNGQNGQGSGGANGQNGLGSTAHFGNGNGVSSKLHHHHHHHYHHHHAAAVVGAPTTAAAQKPPAPVAPGNNKGHAKGNGNSSGGNSAGEKGSGGDGSNGNGSGGNGSGANGSGNQNGIINSTMDGTSKLNHMPPPPAPTAGPIGPVKATTTSAGGGAQVKAIGAAIPPKPPPAGGVTVAAVDNTNALNKTNIAIAVQQQQQVAMGDQQHVLTTQAVQAAMQALQATGMHQLILQQSYMAAAAAATGAYPPAIPQQGWVQPPSAPPAGVSFEAYATTLQHLAAQYGSGNPPPRPRSAFQPPQSQQTTQNQQKRHRPQYAQQQDDDGQEDPSTAHAPASRPMSTAAGGSGGAKPASKANNNRTSGRSGSASYEESGERGRKRSTSGSPRLGSGGSSRKKSRPMPSSS